MKRDTRKATSITDGHSVPLAENFPNVETVSESTLRDETFVPTGEGGQREIGTSTKQGFLETLRKHMSAVAYAEAGEYEAAQEMVAGSKVRNSILFVIEGTSSASATFDYALNLCRRTSSQLDILQVIEISSDTDDYAHLSRALSEVSQNIVDLMKKVDGGKIPVKVTIRLGDVNQKLINYAKRHSEVSMVILDSPKIRCASEHDKVWKRMIQNLAQKLSVPLITVDSRELACAR